MSDTDWSQAVDLDATWTGDRWEFDASAPGIWRVVGTLDGQPMTVAYIDSRPDSDWQTVVGEPLLLSAFKRILGDGAIYVAVGQDDRRFRWLTIDGSLYTVTPEEVAAIERYRDVALAKPFEVVSSEHDYGVKCAATGQVMGGFATLEEATTYASNQVGMTP